MQDPESFLCKSVLINNTLRSIQYAGKRDIGGESGGERAAGRSRAGLPHLLRPALPLPGQPECKRARQGEQQLDLEHTQTIDMLNITKINDVEEDINLVTAIEGERNVEETFDDTEERDEDVEYDVSNPLNSSYYDVSSYSADPLGDCDLTGSPGAVTTMYCDLTAAGAGAGHTWQEGGAGRGGLTAAPSS